MHLHIACSDGIDLLSPLVQDSLVSLSLMEYAGNSVCISMNRFMWEEDEHLRVHSCLQIKNVHSVQTRNFGKDRVLNLLAIQYKDGYLTCYFSRHRALRIKVDAINCEFWDYEDPWPASTAPMHPCLFL